MSLVKSIKDFGGKRANPDACPQNALKMEACACDEGKACEDTITIPEDRTVASFVFEGETFTAAEGETLEQALQRAAMKYEVRTYARVIGDKIVHRGQCSLESVTLDNGAVVEATRVCDCVMVCTYKFNVPTGKDTVPYAITDAEGNEVANGSEASAEFIGNEPQVVSATDETIESEAGDYTLLTVTIREGFTITVDGNEGTKCGCEEMFLAPITE